ncbi:MAG: hypothetical protein IJI58_04640 [Bacilli bacterium]|nr:hypothetical protein [Bacilli bacterium]
MKNLRKNGTIASIIITVVYTLVIYYWMYPSLNINNWGFWIFIISILLVFGSLMSILTLGVAVSELFTGIKRRKRMGYYKIFIAVPVIILLIIIINFFLSPLFNARTYYKRITVDETADFTTDVKEVDFNKLPLLDRDSSEKLGDRVMGQMSELVSQFDVSDQYTQINYNDEIIRVTPLEYNGVIKWLTNRGKGIKGYITVNSTTGKAKLVKLEKGMKYAPSGLFNDNLYRKLQFKYPTFNFGAVDFEIDNEGHPYWVASVIKYAGVGLRREVKGVVIFNPVNGKSKYYSVKDVPRWVDHVYEADLILEQVNDWGSYKKGFINSLISQKGVVKTTAGYNYLAQDDDVYLYTGITSVISDESNIGFILTNMRTKETKFYGVAGAEEFSAMESAKGQVQQMNYSSTFPLLINLNGKPTYLVSLKDNAGLVKMYGFVDVEDYQKVVVTDSSKGIVKASEAYLNDIGEDTSGTKLEKVVTINNLTTASVDGNTYYYFTDNGGQKYKVSIKIDKNNLPFIKNGDSILVRYNTEGTVISILEIELLD